MSCLWTSTCLSEICAQTQMPKMLADGLDGWWFSLSLGILWTWVCLVVVGSVSGVAITWAIRTIRQRRIADAVQAGLASSPTAAAGSMVDTNHLVLQALWQRVAWKDADGRYLGCTQAAAEARGLSNPTQILGKTQLDFLPPAQANQADMLEKCDQRVRKTGQSVTCLMPYTTSHGRIAYEEIFKLPVKDPTGKVIGIVETADSKEDAVCNPSETVTRNVEPSFHADATPAGVAGTSREYWKMVIEDMVEGFALHEVIRDQNGRPTDYRIVDVNPMFEEFVGLRQ